MFYALIVGLEKTITIHTKTSPLLKQQSHMQEKQETINPKEEP